MMPEGEIFHEIIRRLYGANGEKLDRRKESKLYKKEQMTMGRLRSGHHSDLKCWLHKIWRAVDTIYRKCGVGKGTAENVVYDCSRINHPLYDKIWCIVTRVMNLCSTLREVAALETVLASLQEDVAYILETKLLPKDKIPQYMKVRRRPPNSREGKGWWPHYLCTRDNGIISYHPAVGTSNELEKLAVVIQLPRQQEILVDNWYLSPETTNFLQRVGFPD